MRQPSFCAAIRSSSWPAPATSPASSIPPASGKYGYWLNDELPPGPDDWYGGARHHQGSWWTDWSAWNASFSGDQVPAREVGAGELKPLEDAPGSYVKIKAS